MANGRFFGSGYTMILLKDDTMLNILWWYIEECLIERLKPIIHDVMSVSRYTVMVSWRIGERLIEELKEPSMIQCQYINIL